MCAQVIPQSDLPPPNISAGLAHSSEVAIANGKADLALNYLVNNYVSSNAGKYQYLTQPVISVQYRIYYKKTYRNVCPSDI